MNKLHKKRILFITTSYPRYEGDISGSFFIPLLNEIKKEYDITVIAPDDSKIEFYESDVLRFKYFFINKWQKLTYNEGILENLTLNPLLIFQVPFLFITIFFKILTSSKDYDLIITNWLLPSGLAGAIVSRITNKPHLVIEHSAGIHTLLNMPFKKFLFKFISDNSC